MSLFLTRSCQSYGDVGDPPDVQLRLIVPPLRGIAPVPSDSIVREGGSRPWLILLASDMNDYYCKAPHEMAGHPYLGVNELVASGLARRLDIPTRPTEVIEWENHLYVGLQILPNDRKLTGNLTEATVARLSNPGVLYTLIVLDAWTINQDRHDGNWLGGVLGGNAGWFMANDHDMCVLASGIQPPALAGMVTRPIDAGIIRSAVIAGAIVSPFLLREAIDKVESISDREIRLIVGAVPDEWLDAPGRGQVAQFLIDRQARLGGLFADSLALFPNLEHFGMPNLEQL